MRGLKKRTDILTNQMDVEKLIRKELRGKEITIRPNNTLATTVVNYIHNKVLEKRHEDKKKSGEEFHYEPQEEVACYCLEEISAKLLSIFLERAPDDVMKQHVIASNIPYEELKKYAEKKKLTIQPLLLSEQEQDILSLIHEHGDDQTLLGLRKSFEYLQKEYEKQQATHLKKKE